MNNDKYFTGKLLVGGALGLGLAALLISAGETSRRHEAAGRAIVGNDRGHYGRWRY
jgi:ketosteroid isomerase-like protein